MNSRGQLEYRANTQIITLSEIAPEFTEPERLRLRLSPKVLKKPFDIGSFAYVIRGKNKSMHDDRSTPVEIKSFVESRRKFIARLLETFIGQRELTVLTKLRNTEYLVEWLNEQGYRDFFTSAAQAQQAYRDYTAHLNHRINSQSLKPITGRGMQAFFSMLIDLLYPEISHHILAGAVSITAGRGSEEPARTVDVEAHRDVCLAIARQCSAFILNNQSYPVVVSIRDYEVVGFPSNHGWVGPFKESPLAYNAGARRIATVEEYLKDSEKLGRKLPLKSTVKSALAAAKASLDAANRDDRHWHRLNMAGLAMKAYASLFLMITGATPTEFLQFKYADALDVEKSPLKKELSAVKFRAGGKSTLYTIGQGTALSLLKDYLKLREWILNGATHELLFFSMPSASKRVRVDNEFSEFKAIYLLPKFFKVVSGTFLDPKVPKLSPRKMRKQKSLGMHAAGVAPSTVAVTLNHSVETNLAAYSDATPEQQESEFGQFWQAMRHAAKVASERSLKPAEAKIPTAAGHCDGFNNPIPAHHIADVSIELNCRSQYGCLYCEHYICHSDEEDLHKLVSLQYVINAVRNAAPDTNHAESLYKELSIRIEFILEALGERSDEVQQSVEAIKSKVFEYGELTPFWERRLSRYEKMGVAF